jgi:hypothetical protein
MSLYELKGREYSTVIKNPGWNYGRAKSNRKSRENREKDETPIGTKARPTE